MHDTEPILRVQSLSKSYKPGLFKARHQALNAVDLEVGRGSVFGLLGPNGAGKTTLIKCLLGLVRFQQGQASLFGQPVKRASTRRRVGYLPEAHRLPGYLTGRQVLRLFAMLSGRSKAWVEPRIDAWLDKVGMSESGDRKVKEYSKGMQQRIGLAAAFVHEPELVFLDEPTDGVDPVGRRDIRRLIGDLKQSGTTIFVNSHLLQEVQAIADRVVILHQGNVLHEGGVEELTAREGWRLGLVHAPEDMSAVLGEDAALLSRLAADGSYALAGDEDALDRVVDKLRGAGVGLRELARQSATLEESFIEMVGEEQDS